MPQYRIYVKVGDKKITQEFGKEGKKKPENKIADEAS